MDKKIVKPASAEFARFKELTARLVAVPKNEIEEKEKEYKTTRKKSKVKKPSVGSRTRGTKT